MLIFFPAAVHVAATSEVTLKSCPNAVPDVVVEESPHLVHLLVVFAGLVQVAATVVET